jgi:hypothetical protein
MQSSQPHMSATPRHAALFAGVLTAALWSIPAQVVAQTVVNPTTAEFDPSANHNTTLSDGSSAVTRYDLEFYNIGASSPFQVASLGKPAPQSDGKIRVLLTSVLTSMPSPGIDYVATVAAVGPGGVGRSTQSNTFSFAVPCAWVVSPTSHSVTAAGGSRSSSVTTTTGCAWTATSNASWLTVTTGASGTASGTVTFAAAANTVASPRTGTLTVAGQTVTITQAAACTYSVSPTSATIAAAGGTLSFNVSTASGCSWSVTESASWITVTSANPSSGAGAATITVAANTGTARSATMTVAGQTVTIDQASAAPSAPSNLRVVTGAGQ